MLGVKTHAFFAVGVHVAKQALLPAAKAVPGHRHGNWHIDADHANLYAATEFARHIAIAGVAAHAVAIFMGVDQIDCFGKVFDPHAAQHRAKNFFFVNAHVGRDVVKQGAAHPKAVFAFLASVFAGKGAAVNQQFGAFFNPHIDVAGDALVRNAGNDRAHFSVKIGTVFNHQRFGARGQHGDQFVGHVANQHGN